MMRAPMGNAAHPLDSFRIPLRFLRGNYGRTSLTVLAVALGVALVCAPDQPWPFSR